jgi:ADP-heptose:LPS heptosyltransferase
LLTAPPDRWRGEKLQQKFDSRVYQVPPNLNLKEASAVISRLDLLISPDTSLVHIARSFRVPVVGLYSRFMKNFLLWRPFDQEVGAVVSGNDDNIFDITVDQVFDTFIQVVEKQKPVEK